jgi:putative phosphoribosyl transferase
MWTGAAMMFQDREDAARQLAKALAPWRDRHPVVLAIPRGAVPMGIIIAQALAADFDLVLTRKIAAPGRDEWAIGAVAESGWSTIDPVAGQVGANQAYIAAQITEQRALMSLRRRMYTLRPSPVDLAGRVAIIVDDGLATGSTMIAALHDVRQRAPAQLICAIPVASQDAYRRVSAYADKVVCLQVPEEFYAVAQYYREFDQVSDQQVVALLAQQAASCQ